MWKPVTAGAALALIMTTACGGARLAAPKNSTPARTSDRTTPAMAPTGAVTSLGDAQSYGASETLRIEEYLRGRVPGLQVIPTGNGAFTLRLRGANLSLAGGQEVQPLVVIDGMPVATEQMSRVLSSLNPRDIQRIDVLRDVASTSVYGVRAASGVILIQTTGS